MSDQNFNRARDILFDRPLLIAHAVGYTDMTEIHNIWMKQWIRALLTPNGEYVHMAHRGSFKSSCEEIVIAIIMVVAPWRSICLFRKTDDAVYRTTAGIKNVLRNEVFKTLARDYCGKELEITREVAAAIDTSLNQVKGAQEHFFAQGLGGNMTGQHYDVLVTDDICTLADRTSKAEREKTKTVYLEMHRLLNDKGSMLHTGTPWHANDVFSIMPPAEKYTWRDTGIISEEKLNHIRKITPVQEFSINYELKILPDSDAVFGGLGNLNEDLFPMDGSMLYIDPAFSPTGHDYTALAIGTFTSEGRLAAAGFVYRMPWNRLVNDDGVLTVDLENSIIGRLIRRFNILEIAVETNSLGEMPRLLLGNYGLPIRSVNHSQIGKHRRIMTAATLQEEIDLVGCKDVESRLFNNHVRDYNIDAEFRDAADALAGLVEQMAPEAFLNALAKRK